MYLVNGNLSNASLCSATVLKKYGTLNRLEINRIWQQWQRSAAPGQGELRDRAVAAMHECMNTQSSTLSLNDLNLSTLPDYLPECVRLLKVERMPLTSLPDTLPPNLTQLCVNQCQLEALPVTLPPNLNVLVAMHNSIDALPENLPVNLEILNLSHNPLSRCPIRLPAQLDELNLSHCQLRHFPEHLPGALRILDLSHNLIEHIDDEIMTLSMARETSPAAQNRQPKAGVLPDGLRQIDLSYNRLTRLTPPLPTKLRLLELSHNRLKTIQATLPPALEWLDLSSNQLTHLPDVLPPSLLLMNVNNNFLRCLPQSVFTLRHYACVDVGHNPLPDNIVMGLAQPLPNRDYCGPSLLLTPPSLETTPPGLTLEQLVAVWLPAERRESITVKWSSISQHDSARPFGDFLYRWSITLTASQAQFYKRPMTRWLVKLAEATLLRQRTFSIARNAMATISDRLILIYHLMQEAVILDDVENGNYDEKSGALFRQAEEMFRLERLMHITHEKVSLTSTNGTRDTSGDEIALFLAYINRLRDVLQLSHEGEELASFTASCVTESELARVKSLISVQEIAEFPVWLSRWQPWEMANKRLHAVLREPTSQRGIMPVESHIRQGANPAITCRGNGLQTPDQVSSPRVKPA